MFVQYRPFRALKLHMHTEDKYNDFKICMTDNNVNMHEVKKTLATQIWLYVSCLYGMGTVLSSNKIVLKTDLIRSSRGDTLQYPV